MRPILFSIGPFHLYSFGVMVALGVLCSLALMRMRLQKDPFCTSDDVLDFIFFSALGGFLGARIYFVFQNLSYYSQSPLSAFAIWEGGLTYYGGLPVAVFSLVMVLRRKKIAALKGLDFISPYVALTHAFGRLGCFLNGCCFGSSCRLPWAVSFPKGPVQVHPAQLYEAFSLIAISWILSAYDQKPHRRGFTFAYFLIFCGLGRFAVEFYRERQVEIMGLGLNQWISLLVILIGFSLKQFLIRKDQRMLKHGS